MPESGSRWWLPRRTASAGALGLLLLVLLVLGMFVLGPEPIRPAPPTSSAPTAGQPRLTDLGPCPEMVGFTCGHLGVPLDRGGRLPGTLRLRVAVGDNTDAPRGTLLLLSGGPGQPGVSLLPRITQRIGYLLDDYRLVMIDQRGTGAGALDCPRLQAEVGWSDVLAPSAVAVRECADLLGEARASYPTAATVADLEALRIALDLPNWTLDGVSYGSFVATRYAMTYPERVARLVLDSVVPQAGVPALYTASLRQAATVLRHACQEQNCTHDPAADLATVVRRYGTGVGLLDLLTTASIVEPTLAGRRFPPVLTLLRQAAQGDPEPLDRALAAQRDGPAPSVTDFSAGLHAATLCADLAEPPWGDSAAPLAGREIALRQAVGRLTTEDVWPFDPATVSARGLAETCRHWPPMPAEPAPPASTLTMPVLLLHGDRDLSTPLVWAHEQAALAPRGELVVIAGMGHSIQGRHPEGDRAIRRFLLDAPG